MKKVVLLPALFLLLFFSCELSGKDPKHPGTSSYRPYPGDYVLSVGLLNGGGSIIGADMEVYVTEQFCLQVGIGVLAFGAGVNYHLKPDTRSSYINLGFWHIGLGEYYFQSAIGPSFVYRNREWFQAQVGVGLVFDKGPYQPVSYNLPVMPFLGIGIYLPGKKHW